MKTETYTNKQAMDKLQLTSRSAFYHLKRACPQAFAVMNQGTDSGNPTLYDKQVLDRFMETLECVKAQAHKTS